MVSIQTAFLKALTDADPEVRKAAEDVVGRDLELRWAEADPTRLGLIQRTLRDPSIDRRAVVSAVSRNRSLAADPMILGALRAILEGPDPRPLIPSAAT